MSYPFGNDQFPYGSAAFVSEAELEAAGMFTYTPDAIYCGKAYGRRLWMSSPAGCLLIAGARLGKFTDILCQNLCHGNLRNSTSIIFDTRGEAAAVTSLQVPDGKFCVFWNAHGLHGLPQHNVNPTSHLKWSSPTLKSDIKRFARALLSLSGAAQSEYFERSARRIVEALALILVKTNGVLILPDLYDAVLLLVRGGEAWLDLAYEMHGSGIPECVSIEAEIHAAREDSSGGWKGILGEIQKAVAPLSDDALRTSLSPPFDLEMEDLCRKDQAYKVYLMVPSDQVEDWAPIIKAIFNGARTLKERSPGAPRQTWILDEGGRLSGFSEVVQLFTDGAGIGIRPILVLQDLLQARNLAPNGDHLISSSAATKIIFGVRDLETAKRLSEMIGIQTLDYDDPLLQSRARTSGVQALRDVLGGRDPFEAVARMAQARFETSHRTRKQRLLRTPSELMTMRSDEMYLFADGLSGPVLGTREPYWMQAWMAGRYLGHPFHPPRDEVRVQTFWGQRTRRIVTEPVPARYAHYPQYQDGLWSYVEGRRP